VDLYLYGAANGIILDIAVNRTNELYNDIYAVGAFDSVSELSQIQFCSVGAWDGLEFTKVILVAIVVIYGYRPYYLGWGGLVSSGFGVLCNSEAANCYPRG
jgi:hypothetical protein